MFTDWILNRRSKPIGGFHNAVCYFSRIGKVRAQDQLVAGVIENAMAGKTITLNGIHFEDGLCPLPLEKLDNLMDTYGGLVQYFQICYQAEVVELGSDKSTQASVTFESGGDRQEGPEPPETPSVHVSPNAGIETGNTGGFSNRNGHKDSGFSDSESWTNRQRRIAAALEALNADNDDNWRQNGLPRVDAVELIMGDSSVTRQEIFVVAPGFIRPGLESIENDSLHQ